MSNQVSISLEEFLKESLSLAEAAKKGGAIIRVIGGFAIYMHSDHSQECRDLQQSLNRLGGDRPAFTDLDVAAYGSQWKQVTEFLEKVMRFVPNRMINAVYGRDRLVYNHPVHQYQVDVFLDKLDFSHTILFGKLGSGRLEIDYPTLNLADLMLEKLQIHQLNKKDMIDMLVLLLGHEVGTAQLPQVVDGKHIARTLSQDWGFWYDATTNLKKTSDLTTTLFNEGKVTREAFEKISSRISALLTMIDAEQKSKNWLKRAKDGTRKTWYREVSDLSV